jgi:Sel1 repeat
MRFRIYIFLLCSLSTACFAYPRIEIINLSSDTVRVGEPVTITISGTGDPAWCGVGVEYTDGSAKQEFQLEPKGKVFPLSFTKVFTTVGKAVIRADGKRIFFTLPCFGEASATINVVSENQSTSTISVPTAVPEEALFQLGNSQAASGKDVDALKNFMQAANRNHAKAMNAVGYMYQEGRGTVQDYVAAHTWFEKAFQAGNMDAAINKGILFAKGLGTSSSPYDAYIYFLSASLLADNKSIADEAAKLVDQVAGDVPAERRLRADKVVEGFVKAEKSRRLKNSP